MFSSHLDTALRNTRQIETQSNSDLSLNLYIRKTDSGLETASFNDLVFEQLNSDIYYSPSNYPRVSRHDYRRGSCFSNWLLPPPGCEIVNVDGSIVSRKKVCDHLSRRDYFDLVKLILKDSICDIYSKHSLVTVLYSGGIDSVLLLSLISNLGLLNRTDILTVHNTASEKSNIAFIKDRDRIFGHLDILSNRCHSVNVMRISSDDMTNLVRGTYNDVTQYVTSIVASSILTDALMTGVYGNAVLLHQYRAFNEAARYHDRHIRSNSYCTSLCETDDDGIKMEDAFLTDSRQWSDTVHGKKYYHPIGNDILLKTVRQLNFSDIEPQYIADATFARELIAEWDRSFLDFIDVESPGHYDSLNSDISVPVTRELLINLKVPLDIPHCWAGKNYLDEELEMADKNQCIPINSLVSIKMLQYHSEKCNAILQNR